MLLQNTVHGTLKTDKKLYIIYVFYLRIELTSKGAKVTELL